MLTRADDGGDAAEHTIATRSGGDYEALPYLSLPIAYTQPAHLAALATLHGLATPAPAQARVLELGCASGGNIIPLAARFPGARYVGIDISQRQIADADQRSGAMGLTNIEFRRADIGELPEMHEQFDYVICHGVYSWVPAGVQDAILRVASTCLAPEGIAAISYNVLPGWHQRTIIRDIMRHHAGRQGSPQLRVAKARAILGQLAQSAQASGPYGQLLRHEATVLAQKPASYILGEFLATDNSPCTFQEFTGKAQAHGLAYLCEADLGASARDLLTPPALRTVAELSGQDAGSFEQYLDLFSGRAFRRSILIKSSRLMAAPAAINPQRMLPLHLSARLQSAPVRDGDAIHAFMDARGRPLSTRSPSVGRALDRLSAAFPATVPVRDLAGDGPERSRVARALLDLTIQGRATASALPLEIGQPTDVRPRVWSLARTEAAVGLPGVTSLRHVMVALPKVARAVAVQFDGSHSQAAVTQWLAKAYESGTVRMTEQDRQTGRSPGTLASVTVTEVLRTLGDCAVLAPPSKQAK